MKPWILAPFLAATFLAAPPLFADQAFLDKATGLLSEGKLDETDALAKAALETSPSDPDALVVEGTVVLYRKLVPRRDDSIFHPDSPPGAATDQGLTPEGADAVASFWKKVPDLDPSRAYLWGDLAQMTFRAGDSGRALEFAAKVLQAPGVDSDTLQAAAQVFALNLEWAQAAKVLSGIPGNRTALLYQGLELWRTGKDGWRVPLKAFVDNPGTNPAGAKLAAYLISSAMRDTEAGFVQAIEAENGIATLAVRQKYVDRYPDKLGPRLELARTLAQYGSFTKALAHYGEIDRRTLANTADLRLTVLFQEAWAYQGSARHIEADKLWQTLADSRDFYLRSAAAWFLGESALAQGKPAEAKDWWSRCAGEPARSKYAFWAAEELKNLP